ncbi:MAG: hypothetical protein NG784_15390 [Candidatus Jettenia sp.]|nr:hypothetical protein [Candidatus Jettenia sp.]
MAETKSGACKICIKRVFVFRKATNHLLHIALTGFTLGAWSIIWLLISIRSYGWRCIECGSSEVSQS